MVILDEGLSNGYRSVFLGLALQDDLVQRAVSVCSAFHLGKNQPKLLESAERDRTAIIQRLNHDAFHGTADQIFNISAWATILLLLVTQTVTGEHDFKYLFNMLQSILIHFSTGITESEVHTFLDAQTRMFNLFTPLFVSAEVGVGALQGDIEPHLKFMPAQSEPQGDFDVTKLLKQSICLARDIYLAKVNESSIDVEPLVERMILLLAPVNDQPGMHTFVWSYFIAGASTKNPGYRSFFVNRMRQVFQKTGMRNILSTIEMLEAIWDLPEDSNWTHCQSILQRTLVM